MNSHYYFLSNRKEFENAFRIYLDKKQIEIIEKSFGCSRYIYNYFLDKNYINANENIIFEGIKKYMKELQVS